MKRWKLKEFTESKKVNNMSNKCVYIYYTLQLLCCLKLCVSTSTPTENVTSNVIEYKIDLMHEMLALILAKADVASNFLIAPQEALKLYQQLHRTEEELAVDEATTHANNVVEVDGEVNTETKNDTTVRNEVESKRVNSMKEFEEYFYITESPILVSNTLYVDADTANSFTWKLENLEYVLHEENENNMIANSAVTYNNSQHNHSHNHSNNNNKNHNQLINAVRINSRWVHNFQKRDTHNRKFHMPHIHEHSYLNAMRKDDIFLYANLEALNASALELSLQRWQLKMLIILPHAKNGLGHLLQRLSANVTLLDELCSTKLGEIGSHFDSTLVRVFLPKFEFSQRLVLDDIFQQLLNVTSNVDLHWRRPWQVIQQAHFAVNEDGIGELKPSMVMFWNAFSSLRTKPLMFCVDHPFLFIVHNRQGIQLLGHVAQLHE